MSRSRLQPWRSRATALALALSALCARGAEADPLSRQRLDGLNVIVTPGHPFGDATTKDSLANAKALGTKAIAVVPFLWQASPARPDLQRGNDMGDQELRSAIRDAHALNLAVMVKPQIWVPDRWAGAVEMQSESAWQKWFADYRREVLRIAQIADEEKADAVAIGTELELTSQRPEWTGLIAVARAAYSGRLLYVAHNVEEAVQVPFWDALDAIGVTLYPPLGADDDRQGRRAVMRANADRLEILAALTGKPVVVAEIGLRSAAGAAARPWESVEERAAAPDPALQAAVIGDWLAALDRPAIDGVMIWRWFTDPEAGGMRDTDFTVQGKPAERVLGCAWAHRCQHEQAAVPAP